MNLLCLAVWLIGYAPPRLAPAQEPDACRGSTLDQVKQITASAYRDIQLVDYPSALSKLDDAWRAFPCVTEPVPARTLADYYLFRGLVRYFQGETDQAKQQFADALAILPGLHWREDFGQRPRSKFLDARAESLEWQGGHLICPILTPGVSAYVDGRDIAQGQDMPLAPGTHLLQVRKPDGTWWGRFFDIDDGERLDLPVPDALVARRRLLQRPPADRAMPPEQGGATPMTWTEHRPVYLAAGVSAAALVSGALFGARYWSTRTRLFGGPYHSTEDDPEKDLLLQQNRLAAIGADVSLGVAIVAAGTAYGLYRWKQPANTRTASCILVPLLAPDTAGLSVGVHFP